MAEETDYTTLPIEDRLSHKVWKARLSGYEELIRKFENSSSEDDVVFDMFNKDLTLFKTIVTDSNVVAQETGVLLLTKYLKLGASPQNVNRLQKTAIVESLCEKGLSSSRSGTKTKTIESLMLIIEYIDTPDLVVEDCLKFVKHRLPKLVSGVVMALNQMIENFGCIIILPTPIIKVLPGLFSHADKNVRSETTKLTVELYKWMRDSLVTILFDSLKPIQQKDLNKAFELIENNPPVQKTLTHSQKQQQAKQQQEQLKQDPTEDVVMKDVQQPVFDPFDLLEPVDILSKLPSDLESRANDSNWKERKAVLEETVAILSKAPKIANEDYTDFIRILAKCFKDANLQVVQLSAESIGFLSKGLKSKFSKYVSIVLVPILERNKEKKPSFTLVLNDSLDSIFESTSLSDILDGVLKTMNHKTPQVKIAAADYLQRCLVASDTAPTNTEVENIMSIGVKLLSESQEPIRQASTQMIGTLMKITGERFLKQYLDKVDDNRKGKIIKFYQNVTVNVNINDSKVEKSEAPLVQESSIIPSKRVASSPAKKPARKISNTGRSLTSRPLGNRHVVTPPPNPPVLTKENKDEELEELKKLKSEKETWLKESEQQKMMIENLRTENTRLLSDFTKLKQSFERANKEQSNLNLLMKQKDTQILRLTSDVENAKLKARDLEQTIEMMKLQQRASTTSETLPLITSKERITSGELSSRVNRLSIDGEAKENLVHDKFEPKLSYINNEESWKKAAEVTNQLKARIEKMKSRSRIQSDL